MSKILRAAVVFSAALTVISAARAAGRDLMVNSTEKSALVKVKGTVTVDGPEKQIHFASDTGEELTVPCAAVTNLGYTKNSKELKKAVAAEVAAAPFTMGLSLIGLAFKSHGNFMLLAYGDQQQAVFKLDNETYAGRLQAASACTGKPITTIGK
jgi:hypothetical protein